MDVNVPPELESAPVPAQEFALGAEPEPASNLPPWLIQPPPEKRPFKWPDGAKSPTWFKKMGECPRAHAQRYRYYREDPQNMYAVVGTVIHGAIEDAVNIRYRGGRRGQIPPKASPLELTHLLEHQKGAVRQFLDVVRSPDSHSIVTAAVLKACRAILAEVEPIDLSNVWVDSRGNIGCEYIWHYPISPGLHAAGVLDLIQVYSDPFTGEQTVVISDWKTGPADLPTRKELAADPQANLQLAWARRAFPGAKRITFVIRNLTQKESVPLDWSPGLEETALAFARAAWARWNQKDESGVTGPHCSYCPYRSDCNPYLKFMKKSQVNEFARSLDKMTFGELALERYTAHSTLKISEKRKQDCDAILLPMLGEKTSELTPGGIEVSRRSTSAQVVENSSVLLRELSNLAGVPLEEVVSLCCNVQIDSIRSWVETLPHEKAAMAMNLLNGSIRSIRGRPYIVTSLKGKLL